MLLCSVKLREILIAIMTPFFLFGPEALKVWVNWRLVQWGSADFLKWVSWRQRTSHLDSLAVLHMEDLLAG